MDTYELSPLELREMGEPDPCPCISTYREYVDTPTGRDMYDVCVDCGASALMGPWVTPW